MRMKGETFPLLIIEAQSVMLIMPPRSYPFPTLAAAPTPSNSTSPPSLPRWFSYPSLTLPPPTSLLWHRAGKISTLTPMRPISNRLHPRHLYLVKDFQEVWIWGKNCICSRSMRVLLIDHALLISSIFIKCAISHYKIFEFFFKSLPY